MRILFDRIPSVCPLCRLAARGGHLCRGCEHQWFEQRQQRALCRTCGEDLPALGATTSQCARCRAQPRKFAALVCALDYGLGGQALVQMYKTQRQLALAAVLGALMARAVQPVLRQYQPCAWVPVPASRARLMRNGFSPAQQLARVVAGYTAIDWRLDWLSLTAEGRPQKLLRRHEREAAALDRFVAHRDVRNRCIGVIDDVVTTGSTADATAGALKAAGATEVIVLACARAQARL